MRQFSITNNKGIACVEWNQKDHTMNRISSSFIEELPLLIQQGQSPEVKALVFLSGKKQSFCAGADLTEMLGSGSDLKEKALSEKIRLANKYFDHFEQLDIPKIVAIDGPCLGGGLEWALCFDQILLSEGACLAFPEVRLGLVPALGGCARLPQKIGLKKSIPLITSGKKISGQIAYKIGLSNELIPLFLLKKRALELAQEFIEQKPIKAVPLQQPKADPAPTVPTKKNPVNSSPFCTQGLADTGPVFQEPAKKSPGKKCWQKQQAFLYSVERLIAPALFFMTKKQILKKTKGYYPAPLKALELLKYYRSPKIKQKQESVFIQLFESHKTQNILRLFLLAKKAKKKLTSTSPAVEEIQNVAVFGAGAMGTSIAYLLIDKGFTVRLIDPQEQALCLALRRIEGWWDSRNSWNDKVLGAKACQRQIRQGQMGQGQDQRLNEQISDPLWTTKPKNLIEQKKSRLSLSKNLWGLKTQDLIIEAVSEDLSLKQTLLETISKEPLFIASNSSSLSIKELSKSCHNPDHFFGLHFFNPAHKMSLVEVCLNKKQQDNPQILNFLQKIGKTPVFVKDSPGFIVNRLLLAFIMESLLLFEEGWPIKTLDTLLKKELALPMGPFELMDHVGIDLCVRVQSHLEKAGIVTKKPRFFEKLAGALDTDKKELKTWYLDDKKKKLNPKVLSLKTNKKAKNLNPQEAIFRVREALQNSAKILIQKQIASAKDIDLAMFLGTGFLSSLKIGLDPQKKESKIKQK